MKFASIRFKYNNNLQQSKNSQSPAQIMCYPRDLMRCSSQSLCLEETVETGYRTKRLRLNHSVGSLVENLEFPITPLVFLIAIGHPRVFSGAFCADRLPYSAYVVAIKESSTKDISACSHPCRT